MGEEERESTGMKKQRGGVRVRVRVRVFFSGRRNGKGRGEEASEAGKGV